MPADTPHRKYDDMTWRKIRDVLAGEDAVKDAGTRYLPRLEGQDVGEYVAYKARAEFHEAASRTLDGLTGAIMRKAPVVDLPDGFHDLPGNVTGRGEPLAPFAKRAVREVLAMGRYGVLADVAVGEGAPFLAGYAAEAMLNWKVEVIAGRPTLTLVVLKESGSRAGGDRFENQEVERFRVLELVDGVYTVSVLERVAGPDGGKLATVLGPITPRRTGATLDFIPFQFLGAHALTPEVEKSPLLGLVNVNLSHYRTSADLEHGAHFTALPVYVISGRLAGDEGGRLTVGSPVAWQLEPEGRAEILEYRGQGLDALEKRLERKERHMAVLGARLLEDQKAAAEAAATVDLRHRGENSLLAGIADTVGRGLTRALDWLVWWAGGEKGAARVTLNRDFMEKPLSPQGVVQLVTAWQQGGLGGEALHHNLAQGERLPEGMDFEAWAADIAANGPGVGESGETSDEA